MKVFVSTLFFGCLAFASCQNTKKARATSNKGGSELLYMNEWKLTELQGRGIAANTRAMLAFTAGQVNKVSGNTGCNRLNGTFVLSGDHRLKFAPLATTRMACIDDNAGIIEQQLLQALEKTTAWSASETELELKSGDTVLAKLSAYKPLTAAQELLNGNWELTYISGPRIAFDGLYPNKKPTLNFNLPDTNAGGNSSCNSYGSQVNINGNNISFKDPMQTMMACPGNGEQTYFKALKMVTGFKVESDTLSLLAGEVVILRFLKK